MRRATSLAAAAAAVVVVTGTAARSRADTDRLGASRFLLQFGASIGGAEPAAPAPAFLSGARIAAVADGAVAIDADTGTLFRVAHDGAATAQLAIGADAGMLAYDPWSGIAYVADRSGDRIVEALVDADAITVLRSWSTPAEPYGVALTPDHATVLATAIADRALVAYDVVTGVERWRVGLAREPRGVAVAPDGTTAVVTHLGTGAIERIDLAGAAHAATAVALGTDTDFHVARGAWAAVFVGAMVAVPYQEDVPVAAQVVTDGAYGGGFLPPVAHHLAFVAPDVALPRQAMATLDMNQPRALAWDGAHDVLYVAGMGDDMLTVIRRASQVDPAGGGSVALGTDATRCGPDGVAIDDTGEIVVWCAFSRSVVRVAVTADRLVTGGRVRRAHGPSVIASAMDVDRHAGMELFYGQSSAVSTANLACGSCHLDGRTDGLSWLIKGHPLQTPLLAGRVTGTAPYKWTGSDGDLAASIKSTIHRLSGNGLPKAELAQLATYVAAMPAVRAPTITAADAVARGRALFESDALGCSVCHDGPAYTDGAKHAFAGTLKATDTPSLLGLAASAPYFHDGSAATIEAALRDRGGVHGMTDPAATPLSDDEVADLTAFLESL